MTRRSVATWLGCSEVTEAQALDHCRKQGLDAKATKEFIKFFRMGKADWEVMNG